MSTASALPSGDETETTTEMGSLYADHARERLVHFDDYENWDDYRVCIHSLNENGDHVSKNAFWDDARIEEFVTSTYTAYLSGHNFPGSGAYGVGATKKANCPECGKFMDTGLPEHHTNGLAAVGLICPNYSPAHYVSGCEGHMLQSEAIEKGYYLTIEDYLQQAFGSQ